METTLPTDTKSYTTRDEINRVCESFVEMSAILKQPRDNISDLYFYGSIGPLPLTHNQITMNKEGNVTQRVVATAEIPKGVIVTHYPVHAIGLDHRIQFNTGEKDDEVFSERIERYAKTHSHYVSLRQMDEDDGTPIGVLLIGNPGNTRNPLLLGHVIRDAVGNPFESIAFEDIRDWITFRNNIAMYYIKGKTTLNCRYVSNSDHTLLSVESTRIIKEGEELLLLYGAEFWFHRQYDKDDDKMLCNYLFELLIDDKEFTQWLSKLYK